MKVNVLFFGILTDIVKTSSMQVENIENITSIEDRMSLNFCPLDKILRANKNGPNNRCQRI